MTVFIFGAVFSLSACSDHESRDHSAAMQGKRIVSASTVERIDSTLSSFVDSGILAGVSALIFEKGEEVYFNAFGTSDREANIPMDRSTIVQIYSMTKPITGVALMMLHENGAFDLDDSVSKYAPEFSRLQVYAGETPAGEPVLETPKREPTIRDLTRHTAGFAPSADIPGVGKYLLSADPMNMDNSLTEMAKRLGSVPLWFHPGERWSYGPSVDVQAFLIERISGVPFNRYLQENIFDPLAMGQTGYVVTDGNIERFAAVYHRADDGTLSRIPDEYTREMNMREHTLTPGGFGLTSTLDDYMKFARMLVNEGELDGVRILRPETVHLMATNHLSDSVTERSWLPSKGQVGFGIDFAVRIRPPATNEENFGVPGEFFWDGAASTLFWIDPVNDLAAVLFVQLMPFDRVGLHKKFRDAVYSSYIEQVHAEEN